MTVLCADDYDGIRMPPEKGDTFEANAMTKARWTAGGPYERIVRKHARDILRHVGVAGIATHLFVAGRCYWLGRQWAQAFRCFTLFGLYGLFDPIWLFNTFAQVLRAGGRGSLRFRP